MNVLPTKELKDKVLVAFALNGMIRNNAVRNVLDTAPFGVKVSVLKYFKTISEDSVSDFGPNDTADHIAEMTAIVDGLWAEIKTPSLYIAFHAVR